MQTLSCCLSLRGVRSTRRILRMIKPQARLPFILPEMPAQLARRRVKTKSPTPWWLAITPHFLRTGRHSFFIWGISFTILPRLFSFTNPPKTYENEQNNRANREIRLSAQSGSFVDGVLNTCRD